MSTLACLPVPDATRRVPRVAGNLLVFSGGMHHE